MIAEYERAKTYRKHSSEINYQPLSSEEFDFIKSQRDEAINLFGSNFGEDNGWAHQALGKKDKEKVRFWEIEEKAGLKHIRPFYKLANVNVHSGSIGTVFRLGSPPNKDLLVAGSSIYGLAEPGQNTAYSINLLTNTLLAVDELSLENVGFMLTARKLMDEVVWAFDEIAAKSKDF